MESISDEPTPVDESGAAVEEGAISQQAPQTFTPPPATADVSSGGFGPPDNTDNSRARPSPAPKELQHDILPAAAQGIMQQQQGLRSSSLPPVIGTRQQQQQQQQLLLQPPHAMPHASASPFDQQQVIGYGMLRHQQLSHPLQLQAPSPPQQLPPLPPQQYQQLAGPASPGGAPGVSARPPYVKFFLQRVTTNVAHVLFYVVDIRGLAKLAVVGTDVKLSGHFVYASVSDMAEAPPLRSTNRGRVLEWLAALGASTPADDHEVVLPELAPHHWQQLHSSDPTWTKPQLDRQYTGYREEVGTLSDGRHFKNYYLVDDNGAEKLMVMAEDGARLDRRYTYKAVEDVGGFCFENGKAVTDWLDFILGKCEQPPSFMRRDGPPERKRKKKAGERDTSGTSRSAGALVQLQQHTQSRAVSSGRPPSLVQGMLGLSETAPPLWTGPAQDPQQQQLLMQQQGLAPAGYRAGPLAGGGMAGFSMAAPPGGPGFGPTGLMAPGFSADEPYNVRRVTAGLGPASVPQRQLQGPFEQQPHLQRITTGSAAGYDNSGMGIDEPLSPTSMSEAVAAAGAEVRAVFGVDPDLLDWVTSMPDEATVSRVKACAARLTQYLETCGDEQGPAATQMFNETLTILQLLCQTPVSLRLLEMTGICRPVALLSYYSQPPLRDAATRLTQRWKRVATAAHDCASAALKAPSTQAAAGFRDAGFASNLNLVSP